MSATILDPCCGSRMFWFDKANQGVLFGDIRDAEHVLCDGRVLKVEPDVESRAWARVAELEDKYEPRDDADIARVAL